MTLGPSFVDFLAQVSTQIDVRWLVGLNGFDQSTSDAFAKVCEDKLGEHLYGLELSNEGNLYGRRRSPWNAQLYLDRISSGTAAIAGILRRRKIFSGLSLCSDRLWTPWLIGAGYIERLSPYLREISLHRYSASNCVQVGRRNGVPVDTQLALPTFLDHGLVVRVLGELADQILAFDLPVVLGETGSASCSGFPGISNAVVGSLWSIDYALKAASVGIAQARFHTSGAAPYSGFYPRDGVWRTAATFYAALLVNEALQGGAQVVDITPSSKLPAYAIYSQGRPSRIVLVSYISDPTLVTSSTVILYARSKPCSITVKRLRAPTVTEQWDISYAGLTFMGAPDGRPRGHEVSETIICDANGACPVDLPPQSAALIFLDGDCDRQEAQPVGSTAQVVLEAEGAQVHGGLNSSVYVARQMLAGVLADPLHSR